jgi:UDP-N-acetylglucosamine 2-epimerase
LADEGITAGVYPVGDVMYDGLRYNFELAQAQSSIMTQLGLQAKRYLLATVHRAGNTDQRDNLAAILAAFAQAGEPVIFPVHPRTRKQIELWQLPVGPNVRLLEPLSYFDILILQKHARLLLTDSGGMQKEIYCLGTPCLTLRDQTEWVETVQAGWNILTGAHTDRIVEAIHSFQAPDTHPPLYGDGHAAEQIVAILSGRCAER